VLIPLLKTLEHPNLDINMSAISCFFSLIVEMNDEIEQTEHNETQEKNGKAGDAFALFFRMGSWFVENGIIESLFKIMSRVD
jgi:hypothetical protein